MSLRMQDVIRHLPSHGNESAQVHNRRIERSRTSKGRIENIHLEILERLANKRVLDEAADYWNKRVKEQAGVDLDLKILKVEKISEYEYKVIAQGNHWANEVYLQHHKAPVSTLGFRIKYMPKTSLDCFHLFHECVYGRGNYHEISYTNPDKYRGREIIPMYAGMIDTNAYDVVKGIAIHTHGEQIPDVLSWDVFARDVA